MKKAVITIKLVPEASKESNDQIKKEIFEDSKIAWCVEIEKVDVVETHSNPVQKDSLK